MSFWAELKRRNVYKVGVAYAIVAWLIIQAAAIVSPALQLPKWTLPLIIILLSIGFLITLFLAWAYEVTPEGIKRTKEVPLAESITHLTGQKLNYIVTGLLVVAVAFLVFKVYVTDQHAPEQKVISTELEQAPVVADVEEAPKTIAVLPFDDLSPEKDQEYFVLGLSEEILNSLAQIEDLTVIAKTSSFSFKGTNKTIQEIAEVLGVENILEGSVRKAGNALRITAQLVKAVDGSHLWSKTYDRELKDIFDLQEDIATAVADELKVTLGIGKSLKLLGGTDNLEAYELYLNVKGQPLAFMGDDLSSALESIDTAIALDPKFALAWAEKANIHNNISMGLPADLQSSEQELILKASLKAIELEPDLAEAYAPLAEYRMNRAELIEAELAYRKAYELLTESSVLLEGYPQLLLSVGYFNRLKEISDSARRNDPLNMMNRHQYISSLSLLGDRESAEKEYERCEKLFGDDWNAVIRIQISLGYGETVISEDLSSWVFEDEVRIDLESKEKGLAELHRVYLDNEKLDSRGLPFIPLLAANLGDHELAMDALEKVASRNTGAIFFAWFPVMREVRQLPRFKVFVKNIGLVDYWNEFGWPDICHKLDNGDFVCD